MVRTRLKPSSSLAAVIVAVHAAAGVTVFPLDVAAGSKAALIAAVLASLAHALRRYALLRSPRSILALEVHDREKAAILTREGDWRDARILCTSCVTPSLTVLDLAVEGTRFAKHVLLVRDNVDPEDFRKIRVVLRWARQKRDAAEPGSADAA